MRDIKRNRKLQNSERNPDGENFRTFPVCSQPPFLVRFQRNEWKVRNFLITIATFITHLTKSNGERARAQSQQTCFICRRFEIQSLASQETRFCDGMWWKKTLNQRSWKPLWLVQPVKIDSADFDGLTISLRQCRIFKHLHSYQLLAPEICKLRNSYF